MNQAKILRLFDEADDIVSALYRQGANKDYKCKSLREKLKAIAAEISEKPKSNDEKKKITNGDRIRNMTDEELQQFLCQISTCETCPFAECGCAVEEWIKQEANENAGHS